VTGANGARSTGEARTLSSMSTVAERLTADAYLAREDPRRTELVDGAVVVNEPSILHQHVCGLAYRALAAWTETAGGRGTATLPINVPLDAGNVLAPDVLWFDGELTLAAVNAPRVPDLVVEVRSPGTWRYDIGRKRDLYERHGVLELWLADTSSRTMLVYRRSEPRSGFDIARELGADETLESPLLPGFAVSVGALLPAVA
jgi:Uma2 family endonuclease